MSSIGIKNHILLTRSTKHVTTQCEVDSNIKQSSKRHMEAISELDREAKQAIWAILRYIMINLIVWE